jgi:hypothetical protein
LIDTWRTAEGSVCDLHESFLYVVSLKAIADPSGKVVAPNAEVARTATGILLGTRTSVLPNIEENKLFGLLTSPSQAIITPVFLTVFVRKAGINSFDACSDIMLVL